MLWSLRAMAADAPTPRWWCVHPGGDWVRQAMGLGSLTVERVSACESLRLKAEHQAVISSFTRIQATSRQ